MLNSDAYPPSISKNDHVPIDGTQVLLVFPGAYKAPDPQIPLSLVHLAASLQEEGFLVRILDMRVEDYRRCKVGRPIFVGITCMSGLQIKYALEFACYFRAQNPNCPIIWGGVHPSLLPEQTAMSRLVDIVVRGEGELVIKELAKALALGKPLDRVAGITYKTNSEVKSNLDGSIVDLDELPIALPYNLLNLDRYPSLRSGRFHIQTSRGCPHRCGFCYNLFFNKNGWRGKSAERVLEEIEYILKKYPQIKVIDPIDDNFFVDKKRVENFCMGLIERKLDVQWRANCRFDYVAVYDEKFLKLLEKAGCVELDFGGESGSDRLQKIMCKDVTADEMTQSVEKLRRWAPSIEPFVSWMSGLPEETDYDLQQTFDLMDKMSKINPKTQHYGVFVYTPFPSPLMSSLPSEFTPPQTLEEWGKIEAFRYRAPWHSGEQVRKLLAISAVTRYAFYPESRSSKRGLDFKIGFRIINWLARYRWRHRYFGFPVDLKIVDALSRKFKGFV